jgi:fucose permease
VRQAAGLIREPVLLALGFMLFLQSGMEITMGGWSATFAAEELGLDARTSLYFLSTYWLGMMVARLALGAVLARLSPQRVLAASFALGLVGAATLLATRDVALATAAIFCVGAGFAAVFPVVLGWVGERYTTLSGTAFSIALVMALTGGMLLPYLAGLLGNVMGMRASLVIVPVAIVAAAAVLAVLESARVLTRGTQPQTEPG